MGRFAKGNPGGPGNPFARRVNRLRSELLGIFDEDAPRELGNPGDTNWKAMVRALVAKAQQGDVAAMKLALGYGIGEPYSIQREELERRIAELEGENASDPDEAGEGD